MPPTPQQVYNHSAHMAPAASPQGGASSQPNGMPSYAHGYNLSFDASQQSLSQPAQPAYSQSFPNGPIPSSGGYARSFGVEGMAAPLRGYADKPSIYTAVYSGVSVYEMEIGGVACMRRRSDGWLNATQILKVAGVDKGKRTKVLEKEILTGEHEKVQGGYGKYQGTWISYQRGREFCRQYGVEDILKPLLEHDVQADGSGGRANDTPTKEQALAAQRKRFYTSNQDARPNGPVSNGTFFSNISPSTSVALAAMNKAARLNSPAPRPPSAQRPSNVRQPSQQDLTGSQQSMVSDLDGKSDSGYGTQSLRPQGEPPRKRMRQDSPDVPAPSTLPLDASMRSTTPTEANESFLYEQVLMQESVNGAGDPVALPPLPSPSTEDQQEKLNLILDLFADSTRSDYANHPALTQLSKDDLILPLDASANNALHWAATLAKVPLMRLLIQRGASIYRGNAAGQSPLISAVLVSNSWEHSCFPDVLELLGPLIEVRDLQGRTILHHIGVSSGIKGRAPSSKYYLEALLEFLVRVGTKPDAAGGAQAAAVAMANMQSGSQRTSGDSSSQETTAPAAGSIHGPVSLSRFLSHIVNAKDKAGNTALQLVSRIGNRSIIQQLLEIHADPRLANNKGICARDFGVGLEPGELPYENGVGLAGQLPVSTMQRLPGTQESFVADGESAAGAPVSQVEEMGQDVIASMTSMLMQNLASHKELLRTKSEAIDRMNEQIRELSAMQKTELDRLHQMKERVKLREERKAKIANLQREIAKKRSTVKRMQARKAMDLDPDWLHSDVDLSLPMDGRPTDHQRQFASHSLPSARTLQVRVNAYTAANHKLQAHADLLRSRSIELETLYRKVVALCTGVDEAKIEESLPALVAAIESEKGALAEQEVGRVREFLRRVDGGSALTAKDMLPAVLDDEDAYDGPTLMVNPTVTAAAARAEAARRRAARVRM